jgi:hypothetical protein
MINYMTATAATLQTNSSTITVTGESVDFSKIDDNYVVLLDNGLYVMPVLSGSSFDGSGNSTLTLVEPWQGAPLNNKKLLVIPVFAKVYESVAAMTALNDVTRGILLKLEDLLTATSPTLDVRVGTSATISTVPYGYLADQVQATIDSLNAQHPYPYAMRKVEFEANRKQNNEVFAASGFVHFGNSYDTGEISGDPVNVGMTTRVNESNANKIGLGLAEGFAHNFAVKNSKTQFPSINISGVVTVLDKLSAPSGEDGPFATKVKLPQAEEGTRTYDSSTGVSVTHADSAIAFASETGTNKVVTDRVDMWGFEAFLREITDEDPFVYAKGLIQSTASDIDGLTTTDDTVRPITYFAWYEGDTSSRGKGKNWQTASESQRMTIATNPDNNIFFDDATGSFYQWCIRGRSFAGAGNGDWYNIDVNTSGGASCSFGQNKAFTAEQGIRSNPMVKKGYNGDSNIQTNVEYTGVWKAGDDNYESSANGECYLLVCGTVNRLNQGAYHPSFNPLGTSQVWINTQGHTASWYDSGAETYLTDTYKCFNFSSTPVAGYVIGGEGSSYYSGLSALGIPPLGRPDGRYFDGIYASGSGGVCRDMRYSAWGLTQEDFANTDSAIKSGEYRGHGSLSKTVVFGASNQTVASSKWHIIGSESTFDTSLLTLPLKKVTLVQADGVVLWTSHEFDTSSAYASNGDIYVNLVTNQNRYTSLLYYVVEFGLEASVSGKFTHADVIGNPDDILQCPALKNGWFGGWIPVAPSPTGATVFPLTRKAVTVLGRSVLTTPSDYTSWGYIEASDFDFSTSTNSMSTTSANGSGGGVVLVDYIAESYLTIESDNSKVYGGHSGIGSIFCSSRGNAANQGVFLAESLSGKILTDTLAYNSGQVVAVKGFRLDNGVLVGTYLMHDDVFPLTVGLSNNSPAFKALNYSVVEGQQGFINYAHTELKHDNVIRDWGDDNRIHIVNNQSTMLDENGNTVIVGTARCVEPLGWIKNDK